VTEFGWPWFLLVFALAALLGLLWQLQMARLLNHVAHHLPELYRVLGQPVMHVLWWSWPRRARPGGPLLTVGLLQQNLHLRDVYGPARILALWKLMGLIALNRPAWGLDQRARQLLRNLRLIGLGEAVFLAVMAVLLWV
jgi:hypothetical protein